MATVREAADDGEEDDYYEEVRYIPKLKRIASAYSGDTSSMEDIDLYVDDLHKATPKVVREAMRAACKSKGVKCDHN